MREKVLKVLLDHGTLVEPDAANFILSQKDPVAFIRGYLESRKNLPLVLKLQDIRGTESVLSFSDDAPEPSATPKAQEMQVTFAGMDGESGEKQRLRPVPASASGELQIISDVTGASTCDGSIENFTQFFRDRFRIIRRIIKSHVEMSTPMKIAQTRFMDRDAKIIGMVVDVNKTKNGHLGITVEDDTGELFVLIHKDSELIGESILKDEVLGFIGKIASRPRGSGDHEKKSEMFIPASIHRPKLPVTRTQRRSPADLDVVFMSDIHVGSSHFLSDAWSRFSEWIASPEAKGVRYIVVAGDLVDGIGVYPNQDEELLIQDINKQYEELAHIMKPIPEHITVLMQPGNHDAVRPAEPQPAIAEKFRANFSPNFRFIGNPCYFSIAGVEILSYHGRSIDDLVGSIPGVNYKDPIPPMLEMLKRRLLAVSYGGKTPLAPEAKDYMIINPVPDIMVTGHVHRTAVHPFNGMTLLNASAWQSQTPFQKMHNFHPDPGKIIITNLRTGRCKIKDFMAS
ncbi:MAG: DNA-directed DNA polymerase II small subunit [Thermoplasmata archaeon]